MAQGCNLADFAGAVIPTPSVAMVAAIAPVSLRSARQNPGTAAKGFIRVFENVEGAGNFRRTLRRLLMPANAFAPKDSPLANETLRIPSSAFKRLDFSSVLHQNGERKG